MPNRSHETNANARLTQRPAAALRAAAAASAALVATLGSPAHAQPASAELQTIVVSATRHAMPLVDAPAAITVVTREQIEQRGVDNVLEALRGEVGISLTPRPISGRKAISLRGMDSRHTLVLVDGKRISASDGVIGHSDFQNDWIPAEDIERIEVIRGPMSVLYGAEALGGVVHIVTRPIGDRWAIGALAEGALTEGPRGGDGHRAAVRAAGPLGDSLRLAVTASDVQRDAVASPADARISDAEGRHKRDASVLLSWRPTAAHRLEAEARAGREDRYAAMRERSGARRFFDSRTAVDRDHLSLGWHADWGTASEWRSLLRAYRSEVDNTNQRNNGVAALRPNRLRDEVAEGQLSVAPARGHVLTAGFEWRDETLFNAGLTGGQAAARHQAVYWQDEWAVAPRFALTAGLRVDRHSRFGTETSPRVYAVWRPAPQWTVKGGVGHGYKAPTLKQISADYAEDEGPFTYHGNAAVRPETNNAVELGVGWDTPAAGVQLMAFSNRVDDLIVQRPTVVVAGRQHYVFDNEEKARLKGVEIAGSARLGGGFQLSVNYTYLDATDTRGLRLEKRARHTAGAQLGFAHGPVSGGYRVESVSGLVLASLVAGQPVQRVPSFMTSSVHVQWRLAPQLDLGLAIDNLSDLRMADLSPLYTYAESPRTWRLWLRGRW